MARTIEQIQQSIIDAKNADTTLAGLTSTSKVAIWLLWTWVVATCIWTLEVLYDALKIDVNATLAKQKPHTREWYTTKAKLFQYGDTLASEQDVYSPVDPTKYIIANAAAVELDNLIRIKVAKLAGGIMAKLSTPELTAFTAYMERIKDAGVRLQMTSGDPDDFRVTYDIYYDPLVLDNTGARLDGTNNTPVQDAIEAFIDNLPFNGLFVPNFLIDAVQAVEGVRIGQQTYCAGRYGLLPYGVIGNEYKPDAGYMILDSAYFIANTNYYPHEPI